MKPLWIGSSWKMNKTSGDVDVFCQHMKEALVGSDFQMEIQMFVIPAFPYVKTVYDQLNDSGVLVGVQNICWDEAGPYTGEVSARMADDLNASLVEIGHSERRAMFGETDQTVNLKVHAALSERLTPLVCVGDTAQEKEWCVSAEAIVRQVKIALYGLSIEQVKKVLIAYEPVWAIGEFGIPASPEEAEAGLLEIRNALAECYSPELARSMTLLYGGSVHQGNAKDLLAQTNVDGLFIGRSAWQPESFLQLIGIAENYNKTRR
ncbi:triose-phosphate isomerase [Vibrio sp. DW001]|uniref:triose-phosphate isomerase n=1 Tax=Vibrio sp. DW001 TaxID=2912315 RepID=UPI0023AF65DC|nr:triose-phosphate isomerase [Vibrio sp. DW001]WED28764.1 triose-phosphate isomerase [Vibrio sp. DW001]